MEHDLALPDGFVLDNAAPPEGFVLDSPETPDKGFLERSGGDLSKRGKNLGKIFSGEFDQTLPEDVLQVGGQLAGGIGDIAGEALVSVGKGVSAITPDFIEEPVVDIAKDLGSAILETPVGKFGLEALKQGGSKYQKFKEDYPRATRNLESVVNVGLLAVPVKAKPTIGKSSILKKGENLIAKGAAQEKDIKRAFVTELTAPKPTPTVKAERATRTIEKGGFFGGREVELTARESGIVDAVSNVNGVSSNNTALVNLNLIKEESKKEAKTLAKAMKRSEVIFPRKEYLNALEEVKQTLARSPVLTGDAGKTGDAIMAEMIRIFNKNPSTGSGLLASRKELDRFVKSQKGGAAFDPAKENAFSIALREIRNTTNDFIDKRVTNVAVKKSFKKQSNLIAAQENIAHKVTVEKATKIGRLIDNIKKTIPLKGNIEQTIGVVSAGVLASQAPTIAGSLVGAIVAGKVGKAVMSPTTKKIVGNILKNSARAIIKARKIKNETLLKQLTADRAILLSLINGDKNE